MAQGDVIRRLAREGARMMCGRWSQSLLTGTIERPPFKENIALLEGLVESFEALVYERVADELFGPERIGWLEPGWPRRR